MSSHGENPESSWVPEQIDLLCDRFETAWKTGTPPDLATYLQEIEEASRPLALRELLRVELEMRRTRGNSPTLGEYQRRFPELAAVVAKAFQTDDQRQLETMDTPKALLTTGFHVRCPHCHNPIELVPDANLSDIECKSCGGNFSLTGSDKVEPQARGSRIGHFELIERLGMGAFGTVWRALDTKLDRTVAVKIPRKGQLDAAETEMFLREARSAAQLRHPNIVSVHEVGREKDSIYLVSDLIQGMSLDKWLEEQRFAPREAAGICATIARALEHAHERGVIHRDLKPQNVLMDAAGQPHLTDFGLAKREAGEITMTMEGQLLGTPAYMSPEQARGESHSADQRSDVYSLGVVLFQLLTGELPFRGNVRMLLKQVLEDDAPAPKQLDNRIPRDLDTICQKCLAKEPSRRYQTARALADDLQRFQRNEVIQARPVGRIERTQRWCKRNPVVATSLVIGSVLLAALALSWMAESQQRKLAESRLEHSRHNVYNLSLAQAASIVEREPKSARSILEDATACPWDLHDFTWRILHRAASGEKVARTVRHLSRLTNLAYSSDGKLLILTTPGKLAVCDAATGRQRLTRNFDCRDASVLALSPDGTGAMVATRSGGAWLLNCDVDDKEVNMDKQPVIKLDNLEIPRTRHAQSTNILPSGASQSPGILARNETASATTGSSISGLRAVFYDAAVPGLSYASINAHLPAVISVCFLPDTKTFVTGDMNGRVVLWRQRHLSGASDRLAWARNDGASSFYAYKVLAKQNGPVQCMAISPDGRSLFTGGADDLIRALDIDKGNVRTTLPGHSGVITCLSIDRDGKTLVSGSDDGSVRVWDLTDQQELCSSKVKDRGVHRVAIAPDGKSVAACGSDGSFLQWSVADGKLAPLAPPDMSRIGRVFAVAYSQDGKSLALATGDGAAIALNTVTQGETNRIEIAPEVTAVAASSNGKAVASGSADGTVKVWDMVAGIAKRTIVASQDNVIAVAFSLDDSLLASLDDTGAVKLWDVGSGNCMARRTVPNARSLAFSPNGDELLAGNGGEWALWSLTTGECVLPPWHKSVAAAGDKQVNLSFSSRNSRLAVFEFDVYKDASCPVAIWDWASGKRIRSCEIEMGRDSGLRTPEQWASLRKAASATENFAISADAKFLVHGDKVVSSSDSKLIGRTKAAQPMFSPDGRTLVCGDGLGFWDPEVVQQRPTLVGPTGALTSASDALASVTQCSFSWDGTVLAAGQQDGRVLVLDAGRLTTKIDFWGDELNGLTPSSDGKYVIWNNGYSHTEVLDASTGNVMHEVRDPSYRGMAAPRISHNGAFAAQLWESDEPGNRREVHVWELASARQVASLRLQPPEAGREAEDSIDGNLRAISNNGKLLAFMPDNGRPIVVRDLRGNKVQSISSPREAWAISPDFTVVATNARQGLSTCVFDLVTGKEFFHAGRDRPGANDDLAFSPDSSLLANGPAIYDLRQLKRESKDAGLRKLMPKCVVTCFSPDGNFILTYPDNSHAAQLGLIEIATGQLKLDLPTESPGVAFAFDGQSIWTKDGANWDISLPPNSMMRRDHQHPTNLIATEVDQLQPGPQPRPTPTVKDSIRLSSKALTLAIRPALRSLSTSSKNGKWLVAAAFRPQDYMLGGRRPVNIYMTKFDLLNHTSKTLTVAHDSQRTDLIDRINSIAISNDGQHILMDDADGCLWFINGQTGDVEHFQTTGGYGRIVLSDDGKHAYVDTGVWDVATGQQATGTEQDAPKISREAEQNLRASFEKASLQNPRRTPFYVDPTGRFAFFHDDFGVTQIDPAKKKEATYDGQQMDSPIAVWDARAKRFVCRLILQDEGRWLAVAPDGRYDASHDGEVDQAYWAGFENGSRIAIGELKSKYYSPGLLPKILSGTDQSSGSPLTYGDLLKSIGSMAVYETVAKE